MLAKEVVKFSGVGIRSYGLTVLVSYQKIATRYFSLELCK